MSLTLDEIRSRFLADGAPKPRLATHRRVDLDAALSVAVMARVLGGRVATLTLDFLDPRTEAVPESCLALDMAAGFKGEGSCFAQLCQLLPESDTRALALLAEHVTLQDSGYAWPSKAVAVGTLGGCLIALRESGASDLELCLWAEGLLDAYLAWGRRQVAEEAADQAALEATSWRAGRRIAVPPEGARTGPLVDAGAEFVVFRDHGSATLGVLRSRKSNFDLKQALEAMLPSRTQWYVDPRGFLIKWNAATPCPWTQDVLAQALESALSAPSESPPCTS